MIKRIATSELRIGMFIHDLDCGWMEHPFIRTRFPVDSGQIIQRIASSGIHHVYIDTERGSDLEYAPTREAVEADLQLQIEEAVESARPRAQVSVQQEQDRARYLYREATSVIRNLMTDVRFGRRMDLSDIEPMAERVVQSAFRNQHALTGITRIKTKDEYTFMHCVSVAGLLAGFAVEMGLPEESIQQIAVGGLIHDIGKTLVPQKILNKPGRLDDDEFEEMKRHVTYSQDVIQETGGVSEIATDVAILHHERMDGAGYPHGLKGREEISLIGRMAAIVDVYDALTSVRIYKEAWEPTMALKKLLEWSSSHFDQELVQHFIRCLGIYPVGSLVQLESGLLGIVMDLGEDMLRPHLKIIYNGKKRYFTKIREIDLSKWENDRIDKAVSPAAFGIDLVDFL